tara:strand:- start:5929 stop:6381 length:453 start_codon:yes stop_codon:yes gene_type:complete
MNINDYLNDKKNRPVAVASMCADPFHHGHVNIINEAKKYGNVVIGLMTDEAMAGYKRKPLIKYENRLKVIQELKSVSHVIPLNDLNFASVAKKYQFEYYLHGDDWINNVQSESRKKLIEVMQEWGGKVIDVPYTNGISSSELQKEIESRD